jgi:hypothetical protein
MDGLIVKGEVVDMYQPSRDPTGYGDGVISCVEVEEIINVNVIVGDRQLKFPVKNGMLMLNIHSVQEIDDPQLREFTTENPFGEYLYDGSYKKNSIVVTYVRYENGISVDVKEDFGDTGRTVYSQNYYGEAAEQAEGIVEQTLSNDLDVDDLVFNLKALTTAA